MEKPTVQEDSTPLTPHPARAYIESRGIKLVWLSIEARIPYPALVAKLSGRSEMTEDDLQKIAKALNVEMDQLPT